MRIGQGVLLRFCRLSTRSVLVFIRMVPVGLISFALLLPANAQYWGDPWGGRQQQRQQQYNPFGGFWGDRSGGLGRSPKGSPAISAAERTGEGAGTRAAPRLLARTASDAAQGRYSQDRSHGRCKRGLARLRA